MESISRIETHCENQMKSVLTSDWHPSIVNLFGGQLESSGGVCINGRRDGACRWSFSILFSHTDLPPPAFSQSKRPPFEFALFDRFPFACFIPLWISIVIPSSL